MFSVDSITFNFPCDIQRKFTIAESDNSGMMLDGSTKKDPIATYLSYTIKLVVPWGRESLYSTLFEILSSPVPEHTFVFPYNQSTIEFKGFVSGGSDDYYREVNGAKVWRGITFTIEMTKPLKVAD